MELILITAASILFLISIYLIFIRPWQHRWGATDEEAARAMPGDDFVQKPAINATRGVTVNAPPEKIWPWIVQIGFGKAGWYSYDYIDNLGKPSADYINPEWQNIKPGDKVYLSKWTYNIVKEIDPDKSLLWVGGDSAATDGTWVWGLYPIDENHTRLITRMRGKYDWKSPWIILLLIVDTFDIFMMRKSMLGIKKRAESLMSSR